MCKKLFFIFFSAVIMFCGHGPLYVYASEYDSFLERSNTRSPNQTIKEIFNLPKKNLKRKAFYVFAHEITGMNDKEINNAISKGEIELILILAGNMKIDVFGFHKKTKTAKKFRRAKPDELVTFLARNGKRIPWFLTSCGNPVKGLTFAKKQAISLDVGKKTKSVNKPPSLPPCCCFYTGPVQVVYGSNTAKYYYRLGFLTYEEQGSPVGTFQQVYCSDCSTSNIE